ncbi:MAG: hypothetical protein QOE22_335 [Candidatus Parcubacteria bacterium]|jgi:hypothetical protein|nr:hypothetical protein [Candidatus Parcubacteria bacterium]
MKVQTNLGCSCPYWLTSKSPDEKQLRDLVAGDTLQAGGDGVGIEPVWKEWFSELG